MTAVMKATPAIPAGEFEPRRQARLLRQDIFDRKKPPTFRFYIDEYAICRTGVEWDIVSDQVHHLLRMSVRPYVCIRVIPAATGFHAGRMPFQLIEFAELSPVVFIETDTSALFLEREDTIDGYRKIEAELSGIAMNDADSRRWLTALVSQPNDSRQNRNGERSTAIFDPDEE